MSTMSENTIFVPGWGILHLWSKEPQDDGAGKVCGVKPTSGFTNEIDEDQLFHGRVSSALPANSLDL